MLHVHGASMLGVHDPCPYRPSYCSRLPVPAAAAGGRPRFSLVWKLAFLPRQPGQALCLARPEWGPPVSFGSAARVDAVKRRLAAERAASQRGAQH